MDTSNDHSSETLDFLLGDGTKLSTPTDRDLAKLLFTTCDNLMEQGVLADIIGNRQVTSGENYTLRRALDATPEYNNSRLRTVRARKILSTYHANNRDSSAIKAHDHVYVACTRTESFWLIVTESDDGEYALSHLNVESMATFFSYRSEWATHIGQLVLSKLTETMREEVTARRERLRKMESCKTTLLQMSGRISSAFITPRTSGSGIEG